MRIQVNWQWGVLLMVAWLLAACSGGQGIEIQDAWGRVVPETPNGAFYMVIQNQGREADRLVRASTEVCGIVELHETVMEEGVMRMRPLEGIEVPAGGATTLQMGGLHIMCLERQPELAVGDVTPVTLVFEKAGEIVVDVEIREP